MKTIIKYAAAATLAGALAVGLSTPSQAHHGWGAAAVGFGAGALIGAAVAGSANHGYYYYDEPGYAYEPGYYAYEPLYAEPMPRYYYGGARYRSRSSCGQSPASGNFGSCN